MGGGASTAILEEKESEIRKLKRELEEKKAEIDDLQYKLEKPKKDMMVSHFYQI